jgi:hypothetical protein
MVLTGQPWPTALITAAQLGVPVAAVTLGKTLGLMGPGEAPSLLLGALVTIAATALVSGRVRALAQAQEAATPQPPTGRSTG